tara:strand:+ start:59 stop:259 length:201 start_codon:yes stop_codon:yes gene_type:complete
MSGKKEKVTRSKCPPCAGHCKDNVYCFEREKANRILSAVIEERSENVSDADIIWALCVTGDIPVEE